ncbi:MAG: FhaA domain-containing protein [Pyrinomonadaceae bacterium]
MSILDKVRRWIDGETAELVLEQAARDAQIKPRSKAEEFIVKIAREVESVMQNEMVPLPQGTTIIPSEYAIFLSSDDDKEWQGAKRKGLEQGLYHILAERAKEIAGKKKLETRSFVIELRIDGTLEKGEIRVQHSWEDSTGNKTGVLVRPKGIPAFEPAQKAQISQTIPNFPQPTGVQPPPYQAPPPATFQNAGIQQAVPLQNDEPEDMTAVKSRSAELYKLEIWRGGIRQNVVPIYQKEIAIGRGSKSKPVDIPLVGDVEISRRHLTLVTDGAGNFWAVNEGKNPAAINNYELPAGQRVTVTVGVPLNICSYMLRVQPH